MAASILFTSKEYERPPLLRKSLLETLHAVIIDAREVLGFLDGLASRRIQLRMGVLETKAQLLFDSLAFRTGLR